MPDCVSNGLGLGLAEGYGISHGQGLRDSKADNHVPEGDHNRQANGIGNSRSLGRTHPNRNL